MKRLGTVVGLLLLIAAASARRVPVSITDFAFNPDSVVISPHDSVVWTNEGIYIHTSTSGVDGVWDSLWDSGNLASGASFTHGFPADGRFPYFCRHHYASGMKGVVIVGTGGTDELPSQVVLNCGLRAFPNPFQHRTTISSRLLSGSPARLAIASVSGQLVRALSLPPAPVAGFLSVDWDGRDNLGRETPAGVYRCVSRDGSVLLTKLP